MAFLGCESHDDGQMLHEVRALRITTTSVSFIYQRFQTGWMKLTVHNGFLGCESQDDGQVLHEGGGALGVLQLLYHSYISAVKPVERNWLNIMAFLGCESHDDGQMLHEVRALRNTDATTTVSFTYERC